MGRARHYKKTFSRTKKPVVWGLRIWRVVFFSTIFLFITATAIFIAYAKDLPRPEKFTEIALAQPTRIYDRTGEVLLYEVFGEEKREIVSLSEIPPHLIDALLVTEDKRFFSHIGVDFQGIARALLTNLSRGTPAQGASTLTQQLARSTFLTTQKTADRKIRELIITLELERRYSKDEILGFYLNQIPMGQNAYGMGAASQLYFGKPVQNLTVAEGAILVAMIKAPTHYSPYGPNKEELLSRKDFILARMEEQKYLSPQARKEAVGQELDFAEASFGIRAPHFVLEVVDQLLDIYGERFIRENGLEVITSLDWKLQEAAQDAIDQYDKRNASFNAHNEALVALDPRSGEILAMVGSKDWFADSFPEGCSPGRNCFFDPQLNIATSLPGRQPGSAFKPFVYAVAFSKGAKDTTTVIDEETNFGIWGGKEYIPKNYDEQFRGEVTLRQALGQSLNIPSIKVLLEMAGIKDSIATAKELGVTTLKDASFYGPSLVLGGGEVRLLDIVSAYGVFATEGKRVPPLYIMRIKDSTGRVVKENKNTGATLLDPAAARMVTDILADNEVRTPVFGPSSSLYIPGKKVAVKTGTTQEFRDAWTIGYTPELVAGVWVGNNDNTPMKKAPGATVAAPIWRAFMDRALTL